MAKSDRAKIFASFNPLKSLGQALIKKEKVIVPKAELADDRMEEIDRALHEISAGRMITVVFYCNGEYQRITGCVSAFSPDESKLAVCKREIPFDNIYDLKIEE